MTIKLIKIDKKHLFNIILLLNLKIDYVKYNSKRVLQAH